VKTPTHQPPDLDNREGLKQFLLSEHKDANATPGLQRAGEDCWRRVVDEEINNVPEIPIRLSYGSTTILRFPEERRWGEKKKHHPLFLHFLFAVRDIPSKKSQ
ncbi:Fibrous sheath-interacting protein 2, partial [Dissostichus eleginoides]